MTTEKGGMVCSVVAAGWEAERSSRFFPDPESVPHRLGKQWRERNGCGSAHAVLSWAVLVELVWETIVMMYQKMKTQKMILIFQCM